VETYIDIGSPVHCILERASEIEADVIVLGSHGHGSLSERVRGTVADRVLRNASRPVLLFPAAALAAEKEGSP
jgi:nucleotide-binding universal stress UspA family protein